MPQTPLPSEVSTGLRDSIPIAVGYFATSLAFGVYCAHAGIEALGAAVISMTNLSSSGQFVGVTLWTDHAGLLEVGVAIFLINLRYLLMSISLGQRLDTSVTWWQRMLIAAGITDEIYALAIRRPRVTVTSYLSMMVLPILGWTSGAVVGVLLGSILPPLLNAAFGVVLYAMFVSIVVPVAKSSRPVLWTVLAAAGLSCLMHWLPVVRHIPTGWQIIIVTLIASAWAATMWPRPEARIGPPAPESGVEA
ncbi:putative branched-subunit amino acid permease [Luteococcus japonicus]|uniref:Putative branched-subunit amino acid permease n=1 Tax=Luteococcus japonicus TaxID=33984 RepID=A0A3N1ZS80_9ACTN|nr:AzlC family ABC transporter permease [Luteococcus japonicus]ROR53588.1 putative branched-subunit amino acid permease [Luteococcus japonicus]